LTTAFVHFFAALGVDAELAFAPEPVPIRSRPATSPAAIAALRVT
jgi:hypothetical protein